MLLEPRKGRGRRYEEIIIPYKTQKPTFWPDIFFGRGSETASLQRLTAGPSPSFVFISGPRRIGKTSLALRFADSEPTETRPHVLRVDLRNKRCASSHAVLHDIASTLSRLDRSVNLRSSQPLEKTIEGLVAKAKKPIILILDEFAGVLESHEKEYLGPELFAWVRTQMERDPKDWPDSGSLRLLFVAPPEGLELLHAPEVHESLGRLEVMTLHTLDGDSAHEMLVRPFTERGVAFHRKVASEIVNQTMGHPYYIILFLKHLAEILNARPGKYEVTKNDIQKCTKTVLDHPICFHGAINEPGSRPSHRAVLRALAHLERRRHVTLGEGGRGPMIPRSEILHLSKLGGVAADAAFARLEKYDLIESHHSPSRESVYRYRIPLIRHWVLKNL